MADSKKKRGRADRVRVSSKQSYELRHIANRYGLTIAEVLDAIAAAKSVMRKKIYAVIEARGFKPKGRR